MTSRQQQSIILLAVLGFMTISLVVAYFVGTNRGAGASSGAMTPVKKFRAKEGTERENVRALLSSVPSVKEETTDDPLEIWGSLDKSNGDSDNKSLTADYRDGVSADKAIDLIRIRLAELPLMGNDEERAALEADMGELLLELDPPDEEAAQIAFARAEELATTPDARVAVDAVRVRVLLDQDAYEEVLALTPPGRYIDTPVSGPRLQIELARGIALEALGNESDAERLYVASIEAAFDESEPDDALIGVTRMIGLRLSRLFREDGRDTEALGLSRRIRAWLGEEDLILR